MSSEHGDGSMPVAMSEGNALDGNGAIGLTGKHPSSGSAGQEPVVSRPTIRALIADVTRMSCQLLASAFSQNCLYPIEVTALAVDSLQVRKTVKEIQPDVAVIGSSLKDGHNTGLQAARELWVSGSQTKVIILTDGTVNGTVVEAFRAGAHGIVSRDDPFEALCKCIYVVCQGQVWISSSQLMDLIDYLVHSGPARLVSPDSSNQLTNREAGVVELVAEGLTNREISRQLNLSEHTVRNYLFRIFNKLGTSTRLELALYVNNQRQGRTISGCQVPELESKSKLWAR